MKQFKELTITGPDQQLVTLIEKVSAKPADGWHRDDSVGNGTDVGSFSRNEGKDSPPVRLFLCHEPGRLCVSNIIPDYGEHGGQLSKSQYNRILDEFAEMVQALQSSFDGQLTLDIASGDAAITDQISGEAAALLERFSSLANKSTSSMHPADFERWAKFLIKAYEEDSSLSEDFLLNWLVKELEWPHECADKLASEYRFARDLLQVYNGASQ